MKASTSDDDQCDSSAGDKNSASPLRNVWRLVLISDTHGMHRNLDMPKGDVLIHGGDFTRFGKLSDVQDFNLWLGELQQQYRHRIVVVGNHEANADWREAATDLLSNATLLSNCDIQIEADRSAAPLRIYGTDFYWPVDSQYFTPPYAEIPEGTHVVVAHGPAAGHVDNGTGCVEMLKHVARVHPRVFVCGHIHEARGCVEGAGPVAGTTFVNAANAPPHDAMPAKAARKKKPAGDPAASPPGASSGSARASMGRQPIVIDIEL